MSTREKWRTQEQPTESATKQDTTAAGLRDAIDRDQFTGRHENLETHGRNPSGIKVTQ